MTELLLLAQLVVQGPACGGLYGITPENSPYLGCFVPAWPGTAGGAQIQVDPLAPGGYRATPVLPEPITAPAPAPPFQINP